MKVTKEIKGITFGGGSCPKYTIDIPEGLKVSPVDGEEGVYFLDEFPEDIFPKDSIILHDAETRGIRLKSDQILELNKFWINTGVIPESGSPLFADQQWRGGTKQIPFYAEAPEKARHKFFCDDPNRPESKQAGWLVRPIYHTSMIGKFCYFKV